MNKFCQSLGPSLNQGSTVHIIVSLWAWYLFWWDSQFMQLPLSAESDLSSASISKQLLYV